MPSCNWLAPTAKAKPVRKVPPMRVPIIVAKAPSATDKFIARAILASFIANSANPFDVSKRGGDCEKSSPAGQRRILGLSGTLDVSSETTENERCQLRAYEALAGGEAG